MQCNSMLRSLVSHSGVDLRLTSERVSVLDCFVLYCMVMMMVMVMVMVTVAVTVTDMATLALTLTMVR
jgi:hypothetical protein